MEVCIEWWAKQKWFTDMATTSPLPYEIHGTVWLGVTWLVIRGQPYSNLMFKPPKAIYRESLFSDSKIENSTATERDIVFIDRGSNDGVKEGDSFYVVQQRDEYLQAYAKDDRKLPPRVIGRIVVVSTESDHSTAVITDASKGIDEGAMVTQEVD